MDIRDFLSLLFKGRRTFLIVLLTYLVVVTTGTLLLPTTYTSTATLFLQSKTEEMSQIDKDNPSISRGVGVTLLDVLSEVEMLLSEELRRQVIENLDLTDGPPAPRGVLSKEPNEDENRQSWSAFLSRNFAVEPITNASIIELSFADSDPERAARIVNGFAESYLSFRRKLTQQDSLIERLEEQRERAVAELQETEERVQVHDRRFNLVATERQKFQLIELLRGLKEKIGGLTAELERQKTEVSELSDGLGGYASEVRNVEQVRDNDSILFLENALTTLRVELSALLQHHTEKHSNVQSVRQNIADVEAHLRQKTEAILASVIYSKKTEIAAIQSQLTVYRNLQIEAETEVSQIRDNELKSEELLLDVEMRRDNLAMISKRLDQARLDSSVGQAGNLDVVIASSGYAPAAPSFPPRFSLVLLFAIATAPFLAFSAVLVFDHLDHTLRTPGDIERHLQIPVLGTIPETQRPNLDGLLSD